MALKSSPAANATSLAGLAFMASGSSPGRGPYGGPIDRANALYLACSPALVAGYLAARAANSPGGRWDGEALRAKLQPSGLGLLVLEGDAVSQAVLPAEHKPSKARIEEFAARISARG